MKSIRPPKKPKRPKRNYWMRHTERTKNLVSRFSRWRAQRCCTVRTAAAFGVLASLAGCGQSGPLTRPATITQAAAVSRTGHTRVVYVRPIASGGLKPGFTITKHARATCPERSVLVSGVACIVGEQRSYESCWPGGPERSTRVVYCMFMPWVRQVAALTLEHSLPVLSFAPKLLRPWGVRLTGGLRCVLSTAKPEELNGMPVRYGCEHNVVLLGKVTTTTEP